MGEVPVQIVEIGTQEYTQVIVRDEPGQGNANHVYEVVNAESGHVFSGVKFQDGPIKEFGVNGIHNEDLLAIVIHRLQGFQSGDYKCRENALALTKLEEAMHWLGHRTNRRKLAGTEGTHEGN